MSHLLRRLWLFLLLVSVPARGTEAARWEQLKLGMTADETVTAIGVPLFRSAGRGFELWIYDNHAEALFYGSLIGWTSPKTGSDAARSVDIWQSTPGGAYFPTFVSVLPAPTAKDAPAATTRTYVWLPIYRYRR